jgi:chromosome partitioning protein
MTKSVVKKPGVVVAVLNMKGGVGKTTVSAHVFRHMYSQLKKSVVLVDFDPQFNLTQTIVSQLAYEKLKSDKRTILSVMEDNTAPSIFKVSSTLGPAPKLEEVGIRLRKFNDAAQTALHLVPGDFDIAKYSLINDSNVLLPVKKRFIEFIKKLQEEKDVICIDCNPSSSFMTLCALQSATHVLVPVRPDRYSLLGLKLLDRFINDMPEIAPKPKLTIILNGVTSQGYDPSVENSLRSDPQFGPKTMVSSLHMSKVLEASHSYTGFATDKKQGWRVTPRMTAIANELGKSLGII